MKQKVPGYFSRKTELYNKPKLEKKNENSIFTYKEFNYHRHDLAYKRQTVQNQGCMLWYVTVKTNVQYSLLNHLFRLN